MRRGVVVGVEAEAGFINLLGGAGGDVFLRGYLLAGAFFFEVCVLLRGNRGDTPRLCFAFVFEALGWVRNFLVGCEWGDER
jgi:hypothetical protein